MIPFECIEAYDVFFYEGTLRAAPTRAGRLGNLYISRCNCARRVPPSVELSRDEQRALDAADRARAATTRYPRALVRALAATGARCGAGWERAESPVRGWSRAGGVGRAKLAIYCGARALPHPHHPLNDIVA